MTDRGHRYEYILRAIVTIVTAYGILSRHHNCILTAYADGLMSVQAQTLHIESYLWVWVRVCQMLNKHCAAIA